MSIFYTLIQNQELPQPVEGVNGVWITYGGSVISSSFAMTGQYVSGGTLQTVYSGGLASGCAILPTASCVVTDGGSAINPCVKGELTISSGGAASDPDIRAGGTLLVLSGATAYNVLSRGGANVIVSSGGSITYVVG